MENQGTTDNNHVEQGNQGEERRTNCARRGSGRTGRRVVAGVFIVFLALAAGFAGGFAGRASAFGSHHGFTTRAMDPAMADQRVERLVRHLAVEVDATPDQRQRLEVIAKAAARDLTPARAQWAEARKRGVELLGASSVDRAALEDLRVAQLALAQTMSERLTRALGDAAEVLSVEQRNKLAQRVQRFSDRSRGPRG